MKSDKKLHTILNTKSSASVPFTEFPEPSLIFAGNLGTSFSAYKQESSRGTGSLNVPKVNLLDSLNFPKSQGKYTSAQASAMAEMLLKKQKRPNMFKTME